MRRTDKRMLVVGLMLAAITITNYSLSAKGADSSSDDASLKQIAGYRQWANITPQPEFVIDGTGLGG